MKRRRKQLCSILFAAVMVFMTFGTCVNAQEVTNTTTIRRNTTWSEDTDIYGTCVVNWGKCLTIPENVTVTIHDGGALQGWGDIIVKGRIIVEAGGHFYRHEYGVYQQTVGPESDIKGSIYIPVLAIKCGSVIISSDALTITSGSAVRAARSSLRPWFEKWNLEAEAELMYMNGVNLVYLVVDIEPRFCTGSPDCLFCKPRRLLRCPFCLGLVQFLPGLSQLFPGVFRFCLCFLVLVLFAPGLLGGALRLLCLAGILRPARFILLPHAVRGTAFPAVLLKLAAFGLRAIMARRAVLSGILVLKPQASGRCGGRPFPFSRSGAIAPGILRRPRPLKIPFVRFLSDDVSLLSKPRAIMARSVLCPVHFLFFVLRAGGHNGVQLGILREAVNKRDGGIPEEQQPFAGIGMGHIGKLVGADPKLFG